MNGTRKVKGFYHTLYSIVLLVLVALLSGKVQFSGDNYVTILLSLSVLAGAFFGANFGEHYSRAVGLRLQNGGSAAQGGS